MEWPNNQNGQVRDEAYPSEVASSRPIGLTRIHCPVEPTEPDASQDVDRVARFNEQLRSGD